MHINLIARTNGVGLDRDVQLVRQELITCGHTVTMSPSRGIPAYHRWIPASQRFDANIFMERVFPRWLSTAPKNFLIPNQERYPLRHVRHLRKIDQVLCKTQHAREIFENLGCNTTYIGFTSDDRNEPTIQPDYRKFFHLAGRSTLKGTETLLSLWNQHPEWPTLTLLQHPENAPDNVPPNVSLISRYIDDIELKQLQNQHGIHLCPSLSEGWGHYIVEAMSVAAVTLTTDAPPMNELIAPSRGILVPFSTSEPRHLGTNFLVDPSQLESAIIKLITSPIPDLAHMGMHARTWFQQNKTDFSEQIKIWSATHF